MNDPTRSKYRHLNFRSKNIYRRFAQDEKNIKTSDFENILNDDIPAHGTYGALLFRPEWRLKRIEILNRDKCCVVCKSTTGLQVHHRQYHFLVKENKFKLPWDYSENLLIALCENCHKRGHRKYKVPTINI